MLFKDVMGNEPLKAQLRNLVNENRISHAQLFLSSSGNHSFALAIAYAQYIFCSNRTPEDSCGVCPSCQKFEQLQHPDLHLYFPNCITKSVKKDPESLNFMNDFREYVHRKRYHIDIDEWLSELGGENKQATINIRDCSNIINHNSIRSYEGGFKVFVLWGFDRLYHTAAPKLLKTLEEPSGNTLFILMTENSDKILSTILSRTQLVKIPKLSNEVIINALVNEFSISENKASDIAAISDGNYIKAIELMNGNADHSEMLKQFELMFSSMVALGKNATPEQIRYMELQKEFAKITAKSRDEQKRFVRFMSRMFRNMMLSNLNATMLLNATTEEKRLLGHFSPFVTLKNSDPILQECNQAIYHIERNVNSTMVFTDLYLKISDILAKK